MSNGGQAEGGQQSIAAPDGEGMVRAAHAAGQSSQALTHLMNLYGDQVYNYCLSMLRSPEDAADALQTAFKQVFVALPELQPRTTYKAWVLGIARNRCLDLLRRRRRWGRLLIQDSEGVDRASEVAPPDPASDAGRLRTALEDCMHRLDAASRDCLLLRFQQELSYEQVARLRSGTSGAIRVRVSRGLASLRSCLRKKGVLP
jgi:RNA polymerase sigma-70 factor (ECF subfamily)